MASLHLFPFGPAILPLYPGPMSVISRSPAVPVRMLLVFIPEIGVSYEIKTGQACEPRYRTPDRRQYIQYYPPPPECLFSSILPLQFLFPGVFALSVNPLLMRMCRAHLSVCHPRQCSEMIIHHCPYQSASLRHLIIVYVSRIVSLMISTCTVFRSVSRRPRF